jgi:hypothetical protein
LIRREQRLVSQLFQRQQTPSGQGDPRRHESSSPGCASTNPVTRGAIETDDMPCLLDSRRLERLSLAVDARLKFYVHANGLYVTFIFLESKFALVM